MKTEDLVLMHMGACAMALPRHSVRELLAPQSVHHEDGLASVMALGQQVPVLILDDAGRPVRSVPAQRRVCAVFLQGGDALALLCDAFEQRIQAPIEQQRLHALPAAMRRSNSPVLAVLQHGDAVAAVSDVATLLRSFGFLKDGARELTS